MQSDYPVRKEVKRPINGEFQNSRSDCDFLIGAEGKEAIKRLHVEGIISYIRSRELEED